jgi:hypothetical protein
MSAPANSQRAVEQVKNDPPQPSGGVIDAVVSSGETYSLMVDSQTEFWT